MAITRSPSAAAISASSSSTKKPPPSPAASTPASPPAATATSSLATSPSGNVTLTAPAFGAAAIHAGALASTGGGTPGTVSVTFNEAADTNLGTNIYVVGSIPALATWDPASALPLTWLNGTGTRGNWRATLTLPAATAVEYKYIKKDGSGAVTWESGANRTLTTGSGGTTQTVNDSWK